MRFVRVHLVEGKVDATWSMAVYSPFDSSPNRSRRNCAFSRACNFARLRMAASNRFDGGGGEVD